MEKPKTEIIISGDRLLHVSYQATDRDGAYWTIMTQSEPKENQLTQEELIALSSDKN